MSAKERLKVAPQDEFIYRFIPATDTASNIETYLLLHGTGGDENDLLPLGQMLAGQARDIAFLSPRGRVSENGAARFFRRLAEGVFDEADLLTRTHELADFIQRTVQRYGLAERQRHRYRIL